ncbi:NAD+ synthase [bacterium]|nr:NAD+ synthase [bacterium]
MTLSKNALPVLPAKKAFSEIVGFLRRTTFSTKSVCVLGVSGGVDSAVVAFLLVNALGKDKVRAIIMPYHSSDRQSIEDALLVINDLDIHHQIIDISSSVDSYFLNFPEAENCRKGNKMARERMSVLYDMAALYKGIVVGTGNKSELLLGYFTKYGDGGVDIEPLGGLYKTYVYELAKYAGVPERIVKKHPTADLWPGQKDEEELGITYEVADQILYFMTDIGEDIQTIINRGFRDSYVKRVDELIKQSEHKRIMPPAPDMSAIFR